MAILDDNLILRRSKYLRSDSVTINRRLPIIKDALPKVSLHFKIITQIFHVYDKSSVAIGLRFIFIFFKKNMQQA